MTPKVAQLSMKLTPTRSSRRPARRSLTALLTLPLLAAGLATPAFGATQAPVTYDVRVLVLDDGSPMVGVIADRLELEGQPVTRIDLTDQRRPALTSDRLVTRDNSGALRAHYTGIVAPNEAPSQLTASERALVATYGSTFGVREVDAYTWAHPEVGLHYAADPGYVGAVDGMEATLTPAATSGAFAYLRGNVTFDDLAPDVTESWGYLATPLPDTAESSFTPLLTAPIPNSDAHGALVGVQTTAGRERMIITFGANSSQQHARILSHGIVSWLTRGVSLTYQRNYFSVHIDDVLLPDALWNTVGNCTVGDDCDPAAYPEDAPGATSRMTADDARYVAAWQRRSGVKLDLVYNAAGAIEQKENADGTDPLEAALLADKQEYRWINHTWSHPYLGCIQDFSTTPWRCATDAAGAIRYQSRVSIRNEVYDNHRYASQNALPNYDAHALVTGEHSGLKTLPQMATDNPFLAGALRDSHIRWVASDASRERDIRRIGPATTVPRYPMNIFYNAQTEAEEVDEYNWIYNDRAHGGSGVCQDNPATSTCIEPLDPATGFDRYIVPLESRIALSHVLNNDPRPHYAHQANLAGERILYPVLDRMLATYRSIYAPNTPIVNPTMGASGTELTRQAAWRKVRGSVSAVLDGQTLTVTNRAGATATVPVTVPSGSRTVASTGAPSSAFGSGYAAQASGLVTVGAGRSFAVALPSTPGLATLAQWTPTAPAAPASTPNPRVEAQVATREVALPTADSDTAPATER